MGDIWRAPIIVSRLQLSAWREQSKAGAMKARLRPSFAAGPVRNVRTSRFGTWLRSGKTLGRLRRCGITLLLRCYGVAARMWNVRTDVAEQAFGPGRGPSSIRVVARYWLRPIGPRPRKCPYSAFASAPRRQGSAERAGLGDGQGHAPQGVAAAHQVGSI